MNRTHITLADLVDNNACSKQCALFVATFGDKAKIWPRAATKAIKAGLYIRWLEKLIPASARAEYEKAKALAWAEYKKVRTAAWPEFGNATPTAWAEYDKATASAWSEYDKATASALVKALTARGEA